MKPELEKIIEAYESSFVAKTVKRANRPLLTQAWHYHPEIEICFTRKSSGQRFVGNKIASYQVGDLVMLGSFLPHGFTTSEKSDQIVIQFNEHFMGTTFLEKPEMRKILELIHRAKMGIEFYGKTQKKATRKIIEILKEQGSIKFIKLLQLLTILANSQEYKIICSKNYSTTLNMDQLSRVKTIFEYIENNYRTDISIPEVAKSLNLSESAFYKFVRKHTKKKFTQIVNEYRINHATKLLIETELTISQICYQCGYNNLSYFNRKFREITEIRPHEFRAKYS